MSADSGWTTARVRLTALADDYARFLAGQDPAAAEATGLPGLALLPRTGPEALAERARFERELRLRVLASPIQGVRWRVARILIDLGVHAWLPVPGEVAVLPGASGDDQWDRPTALAVLRAHTVLGEGFVRFEVDKQLGWPAQALSYVLGERAWLDGRERARRRAAAAGEGLDLRAFHNRSISLGSVGLDLLARELA